MTRFSFAPEVARRQIGPRAAVSFNLEYPPKAEDGAAVEAWKRRSMWQILERRPPRMPGAVRMLVELEERPGRRIHEHLSQPIIALCVERQVIDSDHRNTLREVTLRFVRNVTGARITIESAIEREART